MKFLFRKGSIFFVFKDRKEINILEPESGSDQISDLIFEMSAPKALIPTFLKSFSGKTNETLQMKKKTNKFGS